MVFSSIIFIFYFLPVFLLGYYVAGWRTGALLVGSTAFYVWGEGAYIVLLGALILLNYGGAWLIDRASTETRRRLALVALVALDLAVLGWFKYAGFAAENLNRILPGDPIPLIEQKLPLGISFFTFQLISYAFDVYRRAVAPERDLDKFAAYILMFPHLIAGPIVRYAHIRDEMHADRRKTGHVGLGVQYFIVGLCQKVLIANTVAPVADYAFALSPAALDPLTAWTGAVAYMLQIYFDFCGYSNMAIGLAFMLGFTFPKNFNYPYAAQSITDFWRRWHMSLSSWFRDYVYIPLGGNRRGLARTVRNLLVVFFLTGLWHGAAWNFIVWGLFHGGFLMIERFGLGRGLEASPRVLRHAYALLVVLVGWVFFRAETLGGAVDYLGAMGGLGQAGTPDVALANLMNAQVMAAFLVGALFAFPLLPRIMAQLAAPTAGRAENLPPDLDTRNVHILPILPLLIGFALSIAMLVNSSLNPFLYFRF
ncbi:MAG: MBOAT family O-acyltransferase [Phenylobacterium sp.]|uniref:MBOAT family O-acyltransferase n=1 Tax=Phenylobacterium sp. TaxID=1871053 RepID=UPI00391C0003